MRRLFFLILALLLLAGPAAAYDVLVVQSLRNQAYDDALHGFRSICAASSRVIVLADYAEVDMARIIREDRPRLVLAIGDKAFTALRKVRQTPIVSIMALSLHNAIGNRTNVTGVEPFVAPERYMSVLATLKARKAGILYDPAKTGWYLKRALPAAHREGIELVTREVENPKETLGDLLSLRGKADAFWMIPDSTAITRDTLEAFFHVSREQLVPLISFTAGHLGLGAAAVLEMDQTDMGRQAGEMAQSIINGTAPEALPLAHPRKVTIKTNQAVMRRLGISADIVNKLSSEPRI